MIEIAISALVYWYFVGFMCLLFMFFYNEGNVFERARKLEIGDFLLMIFIAFAGFALMFVIMVIVILSVLDDEHFCDGKIKKFFERRIFPKRRSKGEPKK